MFKKLVPVICITIATLCSCSYPSKIEGSKYLNTNVEDNLIRNEDARRIVINRVVEYVNNLEIYEYSKEVDIAVIEETLNNYRSRLGKILQYEIYEVKPDYVTLYISIIDECNTFSRRYYSDAISIPIIQSEEEVEENAYKEK